MSRGYTGHQAHCGPPYDRTYVWIAHGSRCTRTKLSRLPIHYFRPDTLVTHTDLRYLRSELLSLAGGKWRPPAARVTRARRPMPVVTDRARPNMSDRARTLMAEQRDATRCDAFDSSTDSRMETEYSRTMPSSQLHLVSRYHARRDYISMTLLYRLKLKI